MTTPGIIRPAPDGGRILIEFPYQQQLVHVVKSIARWDREAGEWWVPARRDSIMSLRPLVVDHGFALDEETRQAWRLLADAEARSERDSHAAQADIDIPGLGLTLRPYQLAGVKYASEHRRALIGDEMGLGKTPQALATLERMNAYPAVIICPASLRDNWQAEARKWIPARACEVVDSAGPQPTADMTTDILIASYEFLAAHVHVLRGCDPAAVVCDEAHYLKSSRTKRHAAARKLVRGVDVRLLLTGTPLLNRPQELIALLQILGRLEEVGGVNPRPEAAAALEYHMRKSGRAPRAGEVAFWNFAARYCAARQRKFGWDLSGAKNLPELSRVMRRTCMVRRTKSHVARELPPKRTEIVTVRLGNAQEYAQAAKDYSEYAARMAVRDPAFQRLLERVRDEEEREALILRHMLRARARAANAEQLARLAALRRLSAEGKAAAADEWIRSFLDSAGQRKLVVFGWHRDTTLGVAERHNCPALVGGMSRRQIARAVAGFQGDPKVRLLSCNIQTGGTGHTLTAAADALFLELPWTPAALDQAIDRIHRIGQTQPCTAWLMLARSSIDWAVLRLLNEKRQATRLH